MFHSDSAFATLTSQTLTHEQKLMNLAKEAENAFDVLDIPPRTRHFFETGAINDLFEGHAPYRPRYILPDYGAFVRQGSAFLRLPPPQDLDELLFSLMTLYRHVPSITNFPGVPGQSGHPHRPLPGRLERRGGAQEAAPLPQLSGPHHHRLLLPCQPGPGGHPGGPPAAGGALRGAEHRPNFTLKYDPEVTPTPCRGGHPLFPGLLQPGPVQPSRQPGHL